MLSSTSCLDDMYEPSNDFSMYCMFVCHLHDGSIVVCVRRFFLKKKTKKKKNPFFSPMSNARSSMSSTGSDAGSVSTRIPGTVKFRDLIATVKGKLIQHTLDVIADNLNPGCLKGEVLMVEVLVIPAGCPDRVAFFGVLTTGRNKHTFPWCYMKIAMHGRVVSG